MWGNPVWGRRWAGLTALAVAIGLGVQCYDTLTSQPGHWQNVGTKLFNILFFFTVESNILVVITTALLAWRWERTSTAFASARMMALTGITLTGIVYHAVLGGLVELSGAGLLADILLHTVSPVMVVLGWLVFGPRRLTTPTAVRVSIAFPLLYLVVTLVRGPIVHWYPYPFLDVATKGYAQVAVGSLAVAVVFFAVAFGTSWLDRKLPVRD
ncbi:Pr6Pr family membrane protein [Acidothermaceae bacterium B102]|nr:Pr6Pr family membrane protein [Acidothermaceae bacterium B102]